MPLLRRHKYILTALAFYWPAIFAATHIPVPSDISKAGMSDKTMHFLAYLILVSLAWLSVSPFEKVNWRKAKVWIILAALVWYGAMDEWLQSFVGRSADPKDFVFDVAASITALVIFTFLSFWPGVLALASIIIFCITCLTRVNIVFMDEHINSAFYFLAYTFYTLVWIQCIERLWNVQKSNVKWIAGALLIPICSLAIMAFTAKFLFDKNIWYFDIITGLTAIGLTVAISYSTFKFSQYKQKRLAI